MTQITIKTVDGNRYELDGATEVNKTNIWGMNALSFPCRDDNSGTKYINIHNIVSITIREV